MDSVSELLQNMRLLSMAEIRARLEKLQAKKPTDFAVVEKLFAPKKGARK